MPEEYSQDAQQRITELENRVDELEQAVENTPKQSSVEWLMSQMQNGGGEGVATEDMTTLERYAQMPLEERVQTLEASDMRATLVFDHWDEWARSGPYGDEFITSVQARPATLRVLLRERDPTVAVSEGEGLAWQQVYRAMRAAHRLTDGALRYDEAHRTPDNTDSGTCHALVLEAPGMLPTLYR